MRPIASIKADLKAHRAEMRAAGIKKTSCFNGGLDRATYQANARRFALETELSSAQAQAAALPNPFVAA